MADFNLSHTFLIHGREDMEEKTWKRRHGGEDMEEKTWRRRHGGEDTEEGVTSSIFSGTFFSEFLENFKGIFHVNQSMVINSYPYTMG